MSKTVDDYIAGLSGAPADVAKELHGAILAAGGTRDSVKWGHPIYEAGGPVCLIKAAKDHVTLGFWRGADMLDLDPRLAKGGGKGDMAYIKVKATGEVDGVQLARLVARGIALNAEKGDPFKS
ncbi:MULTISPECIES: DUF1801 domain-containing protein [unclassified Ensifer]|uniref:DUF1801 domain-containing protein n=1 Tax=unclassified Ensifer TaxID=2633371 RepID=UPI000813A167|nr:MULTISPECIES: DUF1801 domain-containing protein [unclassified Ensifer]OCP23451.1 hypothetical protein BC361_22300 [Ensifer sp. LC54]OCP26736.1 hypothetical protein BC363_15475 [Ensifer sp. LC384]OCP34704.1 hypothetical protein BC360_11525 [Ensifer sp. LC163]